MKIKRIALILFQIVAISNALTRQKSTDGITDYILHTPVDPAQMNFLILGYGSEQFTRQLINFAHLIEENGHNSIFAAHP